jgi:hypothetical protein
MKVLLKAAVMSKNPKKAHESVVEDCYDVSKDG